ncbi:D-2-hydroxyacid dehydrogenase [Streptomyces viridochromogenes]|uniref:D-2-hydroxyacid dehydrogenase n=1 Tax=Streptomyces viridochromogenes TaxID=1938 RepID=UPI00069F6C23|nr:D-2-hydroxyacid dehydrogenase [Streptomyces viridochromogenes]KOG07566.1 2-hydroxyacid dehydrogenase [Streptomyces viridochromogenes]KOG12707.1 2-hydroxyacid dehydrogenase [Streptomyces viridochromogenes]
MAREREIRRVLATVPYSEAELDRLRAAFAPARLDVASAGDDTAIAEILEHVDVAVIQGDLDHRYVAAPNLRWVHCDHAGLTRSAVPEVFEKGLIVTGSAGRSAAALAQHVFFFALSLTFDAYGLHDQHRRHVWRGLENYDARLSLWGRTMGIIGLGHTGVEVAKLARAFGMRVLAYRRRDAPAPDTVDRQYCAERGDTVEPLLRDSDMVVIAAHLSDETYHLIGGPELKLMKPTACLINIARGAIVDEAALVAALEAGVIAGAASDVFETEPLPPDAPVWDTPNMIITPHMTPRLPDRTQRSLDIITENVRRYRAGEPLLNALEPHHVFSRPTSAGPAA